MKSFRKHIAFTFIFLLPILHCLAQKNTLTNPVETISEIMNLIINSSPSSNPLLYRHKTERKFLVRKISQLPSELIISDIFKDYEEFEFSSIGLRLPVDYEESNFMINISVSAFKPINQPSYIDNPWVYNTSI